MYKLEEIDKRKTIVPPRIMIAKLVEFTKGTKFWDKFFYFDIDEYSFLEENDTPSNDLKHLWYGYYISDFDNYTVYKNGYDYSIDLDYKFLGLKGNLLKDYNKLFTDKLVIELAIEHESLLAPGNLKLIHV